MSLRAFDLSVLHGLLQTEDYARAVLVGQLPHHTRHEIDQLVELRMRRQEALHLPVPLRLDVVVDESVLVRLVGGRAVMEAQMRRLMELMELPTVSIRIFPFAAGVERAHMGHFILLEIPNDLGSDLVYTEGHAGETFLEGESDVDLYRDVFDDVLAHSLDQGASREVVRRHVSTFVPPRKAPR